MILANLKLAVFISGARIETGKFEAFCLRHALFVDLCRIQHVIGLLGSLALPGTNQRRRGRFPAKFGKLRCLTMSPGGSRVDQSTPQQMHRHMASLIGLTPQFWPDEVSDLLIQAKGRDLCRMSQNSLFQSCLAGWPGI